MCGISGVLAFRNSNFKVTAEYLVPMRDTMAHRGPDGAGLWISTDSHVGPRHRRPSIIDLSDAASQPMSNEDGSLQVVFNVEISWDSKRHSCALHLHLTACLHLLLRLRPPPTPITVLNSKVLPYVRPQRGRSPLRRFRNRNVAAACKLTNSCSRPQLSNNGIRNGRGEMLPEMQDPFIGRESCSLSQ